MKIKISRSKKLLAEAITKVDDIEDGSLGMEHRDSSRASNFSTSSTEGVLWYASFNFHGFLIFVVIPHIARRYRDFEGSLLAKTCRYTKLLMA